MFRPILQNKSETKGQIIMESMSTYAGQILQPIVNARRGRKARNIISLEVSNKHQATH